MVDCSSSSHQCKASNISTILEERITNFSIYLGALYFAFVLLSWDKCSGLVSCTMHMGDEMLEQCQCPQYCEMGQHLPKEKCLWLIGNGLCLSDNDALSSEFYLPFFWNVKEYKREPVLTDRLTI
ncbi:hypothetical protein TorRG33x02_046470 [Trema orientale]|uniref:Uncharacterized protein n=1 Tax=Trema orientale TaxID=63057 RepID=A0A2P5FP09_TREOI|nr:hypothetical protein TorRG33x02_046470 [Trema orientale]